MLLQQQIDDKRKEVRTDSYAMSIGEWISMYQGGEVDIHPVYQRFFRWTPSQKSKSHFCFSIRKWYVGCH